MRFAASLAVAVLLLPPLQAQQKSFDSGGVRIAYLDQGEGEAVVLLHGFTGSAGETASAQVVSALKGYRVLAPDQRGHGLSGKPHDADRYGREMAEDVVRLLDHAKVEKAHVVGYSMGAFVAGKLLASHPDRLRSVTFGGGGPLCQPPPEFVATLDATAESLAKGEGLGALLLALLPDGPKKPTLQQASDFSRLHLFGKDQKALAAVLRGQAGWHVTADQLKANRVPAQFVHGSREVPGLMDGIDRASRLTPGARVVVVDERDHFTTYDTAEFRQAVVSFLRTNNGEPGAPPAQASAASALPCRR
jgi:pimeloyl-ACP methyl ester carboxylesterase